MNDKTEQTSTSESKTVSELQDEIQALKEEIQLLQPISLMLYPENEPKGVPEQRWKQVYPSIVEMLKNEGFQEAYKLIVEDIQKQTFNTQPGDTEKREQLYFQAQAVQALLIKMAYMAKTVQNIKPEA